MENYIALKENISEWIFADQDFLNDYFKGSTIKLHFMYNTLKTIQIQHPKLWDMDVIRNIHFILEKPWNDPSFDCQEQAPFRKINELWWKTYNS